MWKLRRLQWMIVTLGTYLLQLTAAARKMCFFAARIALPLPTLLPRQWRNSEKGKRKTPRVDTFSRTQRSFQGLENPFAVLTKSENSFFLVESCSAPSLPYPSLPVPTRLSPFLPLPYLVKIFYHFLLFLLERRFRSFSRDVTYIPVAILVDQFSRENPKWRSVLKRVKSTIWIIHAKIANKNRPYLCRFMLIS